MASLGEFEIIARYFTRPSRERQGIGDDCALLDVGEHTLAITCDMLVEQVHFFPDVDPESLGHKALAVNLSDLAAAGARPRCFVLALSLPSPDQAWLHAFSQGLFRLAERHDCELVGGDTTRAPRVAAADGPITISVTAIGEVERQLVRGRAGARPGDQIWVSGTLGDAALAIAHRLGRATVAPAQLQLSRRRLDWPTPRVALGRALLGLATAAIDLSDGLLGDLGHILERSGVGADVRWPEVPVSSALAGQDVAMRQSCALAGGDDYELLFTAPPDRHDQVRALAPRLGVDLKVVGEIRAGTGLRLLDAGGAPIETTLHAYDHFAGPDAASR